MVQLSKNLYHTTPEEVFPNSCHSSHQGTHRHVSRTDPAFTRHWECGFSIVLVCYYIGCELKCTHFSVANRRTSWQPFWYAISGKTQVKCMPLITFLQNCLWLNKVILIYITIFSHAYPAMACHNGCHEKRL